MAEFPVPPPNTAAARLTSTDDISFSFEWATATSWLTPKQFTFVMRVMAFCAARSVWTYSPPGDVCAPDEKARLIRITGLSASDLRHCEPILSEFFDRRDGHLWPKLKWFTSAGSVNTRPALSAATRSFVLHRDKFTCCYCGTTNGPFDIDHVVPVVAGGHFHDANNLITACARCNRSKGALSLEEWIGRHGQD